VRQTLEEISNGNVQKPGEAIEAAGRHAVDGAFVFLHLLVDDAGGLTKALAAYRELFAPTAQPLADMHVDIMKIFVGFAAPGHCHEFCQRPGALSKGGSGSPRRSAAKAGE
jgi:hypothetical protein